MLSRRLGSFDHTSSTSWRHQQWPFGQDGEEFKEDSLGIKGDEVENFQNLSFGLLVFVNEIWVSCTSGSRELLCK